MEEYNRVANRTVNRKKNPWVHPWNTTKFNDLYNRDERFFSILVKGTIAYLNQHIMLYDKPINHFIFNTGSSYLYIESNGYEFNWNETSGEDTMYMELPRCVVQLDSINVPQEELSQPFARGNYERKDNDKIKGFNAELRRLPIELTLSLNYVFSNFNEGLIVIQELLNEFVFQRYFNITYLGQVIQCSIEFASSYHIELNKIDLGAADTTLRNLPIQITINTNYPVINERTEIPTGNVIAKFAGFVKGHNRLEDVEILIDGTRSNSEDIYFDLRRYDLNNDGNITDEEIDIITNFITIFDIDQDEEVTSKDMNIITEMFYNNTYNVNFDILHKGAVDLENLNSINLLFNTLDINNDGIVSYYEIDEIIHNIGLFKQFDINKDLKVDFEDINTIISYVIENNNVKYTDLYDDLSTYLDENIPIESKNFRTYILDITKTDIESYKIAIEYYMQTNQIQLEADVINAIYEKIDKLQQFLIFDFNEDHIIDRRDISKVINTINENIDHVISYYYASSIYIHENDNTLSNESLTDTVEFRPLYP